MKYYILDTTLPNQLCLFDSIEGIVNHLEGTVKRKFNLTRDQFCQNLIDLGYGYDDDRGATFTSALAEHFEIGVMRSTSRLRTNIHEATYHTKHKNEFGS